jgi:hypothetical protein
LLDDKIILEKLDNLGLFYSFEMAYTKLPMTVVAPSIDLSQGRLGNTVIHATGKLNYFLCDWHS